jgi:hypothetical protein
MGKAALILLAGTLSMFFAEVCSGASVLWFVTGWAWLLTFWLYLGHLVLLINLALHWKRTSLTSLYLWGVLFGLYESWITKVTWAGYIGAKPILGTVLGFAVCEFPIIVLFYHPVMSFIVPILVLERMSGKERILPGHRSWLVKTRRNWIVALFLVAMSSTFLAFGAKGRMLACAGSILGSVAIMGLLYRLVLRRGTGQFSLLSLKLGSRGLGILIAYIVGLYVLSFLFLLPERIASVPTILLTIVFYGVVIGLLWLAGPCEAPVAEPDHAELFGGREAAWLLGLFLLVSTAMTRLGAFDLVLVLVFYVIVFTAGFGLLVHCTANVLRGWKAQRRHAPDMHVSIGNSGAPT